MAKYPIVVVLDIAGCNALRNSAGVTAELAMRANRIAFHAQNNFGGSYQAVVRPAATRCYARISPADDVARRANQKHNALEKSKWAAGN
jgi:hypothetical protein